MPATPTGDPWLKGHDWALVKAWWRRPDNHQPCARCGGDIDYDTTRRYWASLDVGHIVSRAEARALGWTRAQTNAISNTQPEHASCSRSAGATAGNHARTRATQPLEADDW